MNGKLIMCTKVFRLLTFVGQNLYKWRMGAWKWCITKCALRLKVWGKAYCLKAWFIEQAFMLEEGEKTMFGHVMSVYYLNFDDANVNNEKYLWVYQGGQ